MANPRAQQPLIQSPIGDWINSEGQTITLPGHAIPVTREMQLEIILRSYPSTCTVTIDVLQADLSGKLIYSRHKLPSQLPGDLTTKLLPLQPGWLIAVGANGNAQIPSTTIVKIRAALVLPGTTIDPGLILLNAHTYAAAAICWPWVTRDTLDLVPWSVNFNSNNPSPGGNPVITIPIGIEARLIQASATLTTSAVAGNRYVVLEQQHQNIYYTQIARCQIAQAASTAITYRFGLGNSDEFIDGTMQYKSIDKDQYILHSGSTWRLRAMGMDPADDFGVCTFYAAIRIDDSWNMY